ncbi:Mu-like prophage tail sheath protein gpL [Noviherbaspirillum humi]|uniref:Mu-like prophage tail sheath protein gpL n=1 Tax=Noviherbaspirillum humi TaxID=1688639 RepID=A0A239LEQ5_9BURK|nr:phage tail sheath subtilisin-like domain-containing protein [Noviherbaspirillum humi]SNT28961.1 Mu-like prophage tail sheath protein gpL [Noviherbaspirillum humi]
MSDAAISFNQIPVNLLTPGQYVEFDNSRAIGGLVNMPQRILLIAAMLAAGTASANVPFQVSSANAGIAALGRGSIGAAMVSRLFDVTDAIETWVLPVADNGAGVAATGSLAITGAPTAAGVVNLYVAGQRVQVAVSTSDTPTTIATAIAAAINANADLPVTATSSTGNVTVTSRHKGTLGNDIDLRLNYYPLSEATPAGIAIAITAMANGAGDPSIATALANIGATQYNTIIMAFNDASNVALMETELNTRWGPLYQNDGHCHIGLRGTVGSLNTALSSRNNPHITSWTCETGGEPGPVWEKAALAGALSAYYLAIDPARPLQTLVLPGRLPASADKRFTRAERNNILSYGGATTIVDGGGNVVIERAVTNYKTNSSGIVDPSYRDIETMYTLSLMRYQVRARISQKFPRYKLASDGTLTAPGQAVVTPKIIRAELIALALDWVSAGLMEDIEQFKADLLVARNGTDVNRIDVQLPPNLVNQFRVFAAQIQFRL